MRYFAIFLIWLCPLVTMAGEKEEGAYDVLKKYCLGTALERAEMVSLLDKADARKLNPKEVKAMIGRPGEMWHLRANTTDYWVFTTGAGTCGVNHLALDYREMVEVVSKRFNTKPTADGENDVFTVATFSAELPRVSKDKPDGGTKLIVEISALKTNPKINATSLAVILESVYGSVVREVKAPANCPEEGTRAKSCS